MKAPTALDTARKELAAAKTLAASDEKAAHHAEKTAKAAKLKLKHTRRLAKLLKKSARAAEDKAEKSHEALEQITAKVLKLERRLHKQKKESSAKQSAPEAKARSVKHSAKAILPWKKSTLGQPSATNRLIQTPAPTTKSTTATISRRRSSSREVLPPLRPATATPTTATTAPSVVAPSEPV